MSRSNKVANALCRLSSLFVLTLVVIAATSRLSTACEKTLIGIFQVTTVCHKLNVTVTGTATQIAVVQHPTRIADVGIGTTRFCFGDRSANSSGTNATATVASSNAMEPSPAEYPQYSEPTCAATNQSLREAIYALSHLTLGEIAVATSLAPACDACALIGEHFAQITRTLAALSALLFLLALLSFAVWEMARRAPLQPRSDEALSVDVDCDACVRGCIESVVDGTCGLLKSRCFRCLCMGLSMLPGVLAAVLLTGYTWCIMRFRSAAADVDALRTIRCADATSSTRFVPSTGLWLLLGLFSAAVFASALSCSAFGRRNTEALLQREPRSARDVAGASQPQQQLQLQTAQVVGVVGGAGPALAANGVPMASRLSSLPGSLPAVHTTQSSNTAFPGAQAVPQAVPHAVPQAVGQAMPYAVPQMDAMQAAKAAHGDEVFKGGTGKHSSRVV